MADSIPPNLPIPGQGFDMPDPFDQADVVMPEKTMQPNPLIAPPQIDEELVSEQPVFEQPTISPKKSSYTILIVVIIGCIIVAIAIAGWFIVSSSTQKAMLASPTPTLAPTFTPDVMLATPAPVVGANADDPDNDGLNNAEERLYKTDSNTSDTDGDTYPDGEEVKNGYNPNGEGKLDSDNDTFPDPDERVFGTDPFNPDTDGDGYADGLEIKNGHNPLIPAPNDKL